jgi:hypothetical protein
MINFELDMESKPFRDYHSDQIKLVRDLGWYHGDDLYRCDEECEKILSESVFINNIRRDNICRALKGRIKMLENIAIRKGLLRDRGGEIKNPPAGNNHSREDGLTR